MAIDEGGGALKGGAGKEGGASDAMADEVAFSGGREKRAALPIDLTYGQDEKETNRSLKRKTASGSIARESAKEDGKTAGLTKNGSIHRNSHSQKAGGSCTFSALDLAKAMRKAGVQAQAADPRIMALADQGISPETVAAACEEAKRARPDERIGPVYVVRIVERWAKEAALIAVHGAKAHGKTGRGGEHAERKRVMEGLTGKRMDVGADADAFRTIEGRVRFFDPEALDVVFDVRGEDGDGFSI